MDIHSTPVEVEVVHDNNFDDDDDENNYVLCKYCGDFSCFSCRTLDDPIV